MKISQSIALILILGIFIGCGSDTREEITQWHNYGGEITGTDIMKVSEAVEQIDDVTDKTVVLEGTLKQVCQSRGCWMVVEDAGKSVRVRFVDYGFFVPWESAGKKVRMQGTIKRDTVSEETARHWAEVSDDPDVKPEDIHGDQEVFMMMATAVAIEGGTPISPEQQAVIGGEVEHDHENTH
jgi:hypothetical protein